MAGMYGESTHSIDSKGRISLPSKYRKVLPDDLVIVTSIDTRFPSLEIYSPDGFDAFRDSVFARDGGYQPLSSKHIDLSNKLNSRASSISLDSAGRINIPPKRREDAGLDKDVVLVGNGNHISVFDASVYEKYQEHLDEIDVVGE
ncbi:MAG: hypothetical protein LBM21_01780 [Coriobacteriales bacterium]|jgi:MraZ protein|nr:hypothetical protein [Coriobacteriales bacterium]